MQLKTLSNIMKITLVAGHHFKDSFELLDIMRNLSDSYGRQASF